MAKWSEPIRRPLRTWPRRPRGTWSGRGPSLQDGRSSMKARIIGAAVLVAVLAVAASTAAGATKHARPASITVWLQVDAQSGWPDVVAAANAAFQKQHPGVDVNVQYQTWGHAPRQVRRHARRRQRPRRDRDGQHRDDEVHGGGRLPGPERRPSRPSTTRARGSRAWRPPAGTTASCYGVPYYAGSRVVTYRTDLFKQAGDQGADEPRRSSPPARRSSTRSSARRASRRSTSPAPTGTSRWASSTTSAARSPRR